ncbi:hypothetical protein CI610_01877 [invertebrate metagenome]|uniref:Uncharacterized protein n=1 Tax=invertebrate metagenome TaxID=1711999 RepID=A0A2H9T7K1_9ZZZZ
MDNRTNHSPPTGRSPVSAHNPGSTTKTGHSITLEHASWYGRLVKAIQNLKYRFVSRHGKDAMKIFDAYHTGKRRYIQRSQPGKCYFGSRYYRALNDYKIALAMHQTGMGVITLLQSKENGQITLNEGNNSNAMTDALQQIDTVLKQSVTEILYSLLTSGRKIPPAFIKRALIPHLTEQMIEQSRCTPKQALRQVHQKVRAAGIATEQDITFERILTLKNALRWQYLPQAEPTTPFTSKPSSKPFSSTQPWLTQPTLSAPESSRYLLDEEDKTYIRLAVDNGGSIKIPRHDLRNRIKRLVLRNKRNAANRLAGLGIAMTVAGVATGGIGAVVAVFIQTVSTLSAITGLKRGINMIRLARALARVRHNTDAARLWQQGAGTDDFNEKRFSEFIDDLKLICSKESITAIHTAYAELEKDCNKREKILAAHDDGSLDHAIMVEESRARYLHRRAKLDEKFKAFDLFYTSVVSDIKHMDTQWYSFSHQLWHNHFRHMSSQQRQELFRKAAEDPMLQGERYYFDPEKTPWIPTLFSSVITKSQEQNKKAVAQALEFLETDDKHAHKAAQAAIRLYQETAEFHLVKNSLKEYIKQWGKTVATSVKARAPQLFLRSTFLSGVELELGRLIPELSNKMKDSLPRISGEGVIVFASFLMGDIIVEALNSTQRNDRLRKIRTGGTDFTHTGFFGHFKRERTGREEVNTVRGAAKAKLDEMVSQLNTMHKQQKTLSEELAALEALSKTRSHKPFGGLTEEESHRAVVLLMRRQMLKETLDHKVTGAVGLFYSTVCNKASALDKRMVDIISPAG